MLKVSTEAELLQADTSEKIHLTDDIYITNSFTIIPEFTGRLNGHNHTIYNLQGPLIKELSENAVIENIKFKNISFDSGPANGLAENEVVKKGIVLQNKGLIQSLTVLDTSVNIIGAKITGIIAASNLNTIKNCSVSATVETTNKAGLITGVCIEGDIKNCTVTGRVRGNTVGGIVGKSAGETIENCYTRNTTVQGFRFAGGISGGLMASKIEDCHCSKSTITARRAGGLSSDQSNETIINNSTVTDTNIIAQKHCGGLLAQAHQGLIKDSHITNSTLTTLNANGTCHTLIGYSLLPDTDGATIKNCFSENNTLRTESPKITFEDETTVQNTYMNDTIHTEAEITESLTLPSVYAEILCTKPESNTVTVKTESDLYSINPNDTIKLQDNITITNKNVPVCNLFTGILDGNGYTISGLKTELFYAIGQNALIKNVHLSNIQITDQDYLRGTLAKVTYGKIQNTTVSDGYVEVQSKTILGGLTAKSRNATISNIKISNIELRGSKSVTGGAISRSTLSKLSNIHFTGTIQAHKSGGIVCVCRKNCRVKNCSSTGNIYTKDYAGGLIGRIKYTNNTLKKCSSNSVLYGKNKLGGLIGVGLPEHKVLNSKFNGEIRGNKKCGGIVGKGASKITHSTNNGTIKGKTTIGGLVGKLDDGKITSSKNTGTIIAKQISAGLVASLAGEIQNSANHGLIQGNKKSGGLIGIIENPNNVTLKNCYNDSKITSENPILGTINEDIGAKTTLDKSIDMVLWKNPPNQTYTSKYGKHTTVSKQSLNLLINT